MILVCKVYSNNDDIFIRYYELKYYKQIDTVMYQSLITKYKSISNKYKRTSNRNVYNKRQRVSIQSLNRNNTNSINFIFY
jgi:hypothetical protein